MDIGQRPRPCSAQTKIKLLVITFEQIVIQTSNWCSNVSNYTPIMRLVPSHVSTFFNYLAKRLTLKKSERIKLFLCSRFWFINMSILDRLGRNRWQKRRSNNKYLHCWEIRSTVVDVDTYFHGKRISPFFKGAFKGTLFVRSPVKLHCARSWPKSIFIFHCSSKTRYPERFSYFFVERHKTVVLQ